MPLRSANAISESNGILCGWRLMRRLHSEVTCWDKSDDRKEQGFQIDKPLCFYLSKLSTELLKMLYKVY